MDYSSRLQPWIRSRARNFAISGNNGGLSARYPDYSNDRWIAICPGAASHPVKIWPTDRYGKLVDWLKAKGYRVGLFGSEGDKRWIQEVSATSNSKPINLAGKISLRDVACFLACCQGVVANDSGLMHLGDALGVPTLGILGHTNPDNYHPLGAQATYIEPEEKADCTNGGSQHLGSAGKTCAYGTVSPQKS